MKDIMTDANEGKRLNLADVTTDDKWVHSHDNKGEPPIQHECNDEGSEHQTHILQEYSRAINHYSSQ